MSLTPRLALPLLAAAQAQKHVTHNEALGVLDALLFLAVRDRDRTAPPADAADGDRHIVAPGATGPWAGLDGQVVVRSEGVWRAFAPRAGWLATDLATGVLVRHDGAGWSVPSAVPTVLQNLERVGIGTAADAAHPLTARVDGVLLTARETGEGGGDLRITANKAGPARVLSWLLQSGWSGRAEIGLLGDDDLVLKVSPDGAVWREALRISAASGAVALPQTPPVADLAQRRDLLALSIALADTRGALVLPSVWAEGFLNALAVSAASWNTLFNASGRYVGRSAAGDFGLVTTTIPLDMVPTTLHGLVEIEPIDAITPGIDFFLDLSRDGGTTWAGTMLTQVRANGARRLYDTGPVSVAAQPSGSALRAQVRTANGKNLRVHGLAVHHG